MRGIQSKIPLLILLFSSSAYSEPTEVRIGAILPLSGPMALMGEDIREGFTLGQELLNDENVTFTVLYEDNRFELKDSANAARKLVSESHADVIVSLWEGADAVAPITEQAHIPHISIRWDPGVARRNKYTFTIECTYEQFMRETLSLLKTQGAKRVAVVSQENQASDLAASYLRAHATDYEIHLVSDTSFLAGERDFRTLLARTLGTQPDIVLALAYLPESELLLKQLKVLRPNIPVTGTTHETLPDYSLIDNQPFVTATAPTEEFEKKFVTRFGHTYKLRAPHAVEILRTLKRVYESGPKPAGELAVKRLAEVKGVQGYLGELNVSADHVLESPCVWVVMRNSKKIRITPKEVQEHYRIAPVSQMNATS